MGRETLVVNEQFGQLHRTGYHLWNILRTHMHTCTYVYVSVVFIIDWNRNQICYSLFFSFLQRCDVKFQIYMREIRTGYGENNDKILHGKVGSLLLTVMCILPG